MFTKNHISVVIKSIMILALTGGLFGPQATQVVDASKSIPTTLLSKENITDSSPYMAAETAVLVKDLNPGSASSGAFSYEFEEMNGTLFLSASDATFGRELWKSDGTEDGTILVKDIRPGSTGSSPSYLENVNGTLYFSASDGGLGYELWKSDGTSDGTVLVKDIIPNTSGSYPYYLTGVNGVLYFTASDGIHGRELWKSDGTVDGTNLVLDITPGTGGAGPENLTEVNGTLYFTANDGTHSTELWKSDGTPEGTVMVKDIWPGTVGSYPTRLTNVNGILYFSAAGNLNGYNDEELWKSDGTASGTVLVRDIYPGVNPSSPDSFENVNGTLFFTANDGAHGSELWKSNGTYAGTVMIKDIWPGSNGWGSVFTHVGNTIYFGAYDGVNSRLWKSDGTSAGTLKLDAPAPLDISNANGIVYYSGNDGVYGNELWRSDGTALGTILVKDINPTGYSYPDQFFEVNGTLYFRANDGTHGSELWKVAERPPTTYYVNDDATGANNGSSWTNAYIDLQSALSVAQSGDEIWVAAGTYKPTSGTGRTISFTLKNGVAIYGGFAGTETLRSQRDWETNVTILSGDLNGNDIGFTNNNENSYHVVVGSGTDNTSILDGFTITGGNANGSNPSDRGGGMYNNGNSPTITNITFSRNSARSGGGMANFQNSSDMTVVNVTFNSNSAILGGGMYNYASSLTVTNATFNGNSANSGGGMYNQASPMVVTNVTFSNNQANEGGGMLNSYGTSSTIITNVTLSGNSAIYNGGGMYNLSSTSSMVTNVTFNGNLAGDFGGGVYNYNSSIIFTNITFNGNSTTGSGGGMYNQNSGTSSSRPTLKNVIIANSVGGDCALESSSTLNAASSNNLIEDASNACGFTNGANGNIVGTDPNLGLPTDYGDFTQTIPLLAGSSAIDAGDDGVCPATDQRGVTRPQGSQCDIGAYEVNTLTLIAPTGILTTWNNTFNWIGNSDATTYLLDIYNTDTDAQVLRKWYSNTAAGCDADTSCSISPAELTSLTNGNYKWRIRDYGAYGYGPYTDYLNFALNVAPPPVVTLSAPTGTLTTWNNTFSWSGLSNTTLYLLDIYDANTNAQVLRKWYSNVAAGCDTDTSCSISPTELTSLPNGNYKWRIRDYGSYGYGSYTDFINFTLNVPPPPVVTLSSPKGTLNTWNNTFSWTGLSNATLYLLDVYDANTNAQVLRKWYSNTTAGCDTDTSCSISPAELTSLPNGNYKWRIRDYGPYGYGPYTDFINFTLNIPPTPVVTLDAPSGTLTTWNNTFSWTGLNDATLYLLDIYDADTNAQVLRKWYSNVSAGCDTDTSCSISPSEIAILANGNYKWRIRDYGPYGYGPYSPYMFFDLSQ